MVAQSQFGSLAMEPCGHVATVVWFMHTMGEWDRSRRKCGNVARKWCLVNLEQSSVVLCGIGCTLGVRYKVLGHCGIHSVPPTSSANRIQSSFQRMASLLHYRLIETLPCLPRIYQHKYESKSFHSMWHRRHSQQQRSYSLAQWHWNPVGME